MTPVNYPALLRSGLLAPRLVRTALPVSASEFILTVGTGIPDSAGDFPLRAVRSEPPLPVPRIDSARFLMRFNTVRSMGNRPIDYDKQDNSCID